MWIDLEIVSVTQYISGAPAGMPYPSVGSTHFDDGTPQPDGSMLYNYENLWLRYEIAVPRRCKAVQFKTNYRLALNGPEYIAPQIYGWSVGTADAPGVPNAFKWDVINNTSGLIGGNVLMKPGTQWLWLTFDITGQSNGYVLGVTMPELRGDAYGPGRVYIDGVPRIGTPHVSVSKKLLPGQTFVCKNGSWQPTK